MTGTPFLLDLRATTGLPTIEVDDGDGGALQLHEGTTWLRIRSDVTGFVAPTISPEDDEITGFVPPVFEDDGLAVLVHMRDHQDLEDQTVGLFHARLDPDELESLRAAVVAIEWARVPKPVGGDRYAPQMTLRYTSGKLQINRGFNATSGNFIEAIAPLWNLLDKHTTRTRKSASGTLESLLDVIETPEDPRHRTFRVGLRNRSIGPVAFTDPRVPTPAGPRRLEVRVGECTNEREWISPYAWTTVELPQLPADAPRTVMVASRRRWELELPWVAPKPGRYEVQARWRDYDGPLDTLAGQTPLMPVPSEGPSFVGSGPYPIRGSCRAVGRFTVAEPTPSRRR